jgi:hypothetical protein
MKLALGMKTIAECVLLISAVALAAHAQIAFEDLPKILDSSMPREQQISLALSAAPKGVADDATVYVLGPKGYEQAREGKSGASCFVGRHFTKPTETSIEPMCFDPEGSRTILQAYLYGEQLRSKGMSETEIKAEIAEGYKSGRFQGPAKSGVLYMLSIDNRLGPTADGGTQHVPGHVMFYAPNLTAKDLGYASDAPFLVNPGKPDANMIVFPDPKLKQMF